MQLGTLWRTARQYGKVRVSTMDGGTYHACIEFETIPGVKLEAKSDFKCETPEIALTDAINKAIEVIDGMANQAKQLQSTVKRFT